MKEYKQLLWWSLDIENEVTDAVDDSDRRHRAAHNGQYVDGQVIEWGVFPFVDDVDGLDFCVEMNLLEWLVAVGLPRPQWVPVLLSCFH